MKFIPKIILYLFFFPLLSSCQKDKKGGEQEIEKETLFTLMSSENTGISFVNQIENEKDFNIFMYRNFYNGGGVAVGDINGDGLPDIYFTSNMGENKLYLNKGDFNFEDISSAAGVEGTKSWSTGVTMVDINADGLLDIYVCNAGNVEGDDQKNELFINNGDLTFTEMAAEYNLDDNGFGTHSAFFDYDGDGDLDVYILNNSFIPVSSLGYVNKREVRSEDWNIPEIMKGGGDKLLRNDNGNFTDVSEEAGIYGSLIGFGLGVTIGDINQDFLLDIYVSNDFYERDYLYVNQGDGTFKEQIKDYMQHLSLSSMGADMADINNDGLPDVFVTDMLPEEDSRLKETGDYERYDLYRLKKSRDFYNQYMQNTLQINRADGTFAEIAHYSGVSKTDWSWGALLFDMDNDGYRDIYVSNGIFHDLTNNDFMDFFANDIIQKMTISGEKEEVENIINKMPSTPIPNYALHNQGDLKFVNKATEWGLGQEGFSNGAGYADLDNDGDLDLIVNNLNMPSFIYRNNSEKLEHNFIKLKVKGTGQNTMGIGSSIYLYTGEDVLFQELIPTRGFQSSVDYDMTIGIGKRKAIDSIKIIFPDRSMAVIQDVQINQTLTLNQSEATGKAVTPKKMEKKWFSELLTNFQVNMEDEYIDFNFEGLIPKMQSREGPGIAVGDIDKDGNDDVYIGSPFGTAGKIYLQKKPGKFTDIGFDGGEEFEDTDAEFVDFDMDGDLDLLVTSGGNFENARMGLRVYINEGRMNFIDYKVIAFSKNNISSVLSLDFDDDEDPDLFVSSHSVPGMYGKKVSGMLLENDGKGNFRDITKQIAPDLLNIGMITDAVFEDITGNGEKDLVVVGEWMAPVILSRSNGKFEVVQTNLSKYFGLYNAVYAGDLNNNGKIDLVFGNLGENIDYRASTEAPAKMFVSDFDNNGSVEQIFTRTINGKDIPLHTKRELAGQIVSIKKQNLKFNDYANKSIQDLFSAEVLTGAEVSVITNFQSIVAYNNGNGEFEVEPLPGEAQFSSIASITGKDLDGDGRPDLILGGNNYSLKPQFGRLDSNFGSVLLNKETGFEHAPSSKTGFKFSGEVKALEWLKDSNGNEYIFMGITDDKPKLFKRHE